MIILLTKKNRNQHRVWFLIFLAFCEKRKRFRDKIFTCQEFVPTLIFPISRYKKVDLYIFFFYKKEIHKKSKVFPNKTFFFARILSFPPEKSSQEGRKKTFLKQKRISLEGSFREPFYCFLLVLLLPEGFTLGLPLDLVETFCSPSFFCKVLFLLELSICVFSTDLGLLFFKRLSCGSVE